jgi:crotonobetainyl-CoA:carnitine CoA-transferase CaiB-like acyl-CoA transferase
MALAAATLAGARAGRPVGVDADAVAAHVLLPLLLAVLTGDGPAMAPAAPRPTADGAVCTDLGAEGDAAAFARLLATAPTATPNTAPTATPTTAAPTTARTTFPTARSNDRADDLLGWSAEDLAARAQEWRLPVTPYRRRPSAHSGRTPGGRGGRCEPSSATTPPRKLPAELSGKRPGNRPTTGAWPPLAGLVVVDLTIMWSGPLCTWLLAALGARVVKVEPECRLDGTRFSPGGRLFGALNGGKERADLDLRQDADRRTFADLVARADLVVDNFSPRVAPNLGIDHASLAAINPTVASLSIPAFPPGPERHWVSYGTGVHAASGLGDGGPAGFAAPVVTYPDPLAGLTAAATALALVLARDLGRHPGHGEATLLDAVRPLLAVPDDGALRRPLDAGLAGRLADRVGVPPPSPFLLDAPSAHRRSGGEHGRAAHHGR